MELAHPSPSSAWGLVLPMELQQEWAGGQTCAPRNPERKRSVSRDQFSNMGTVYFAFLWQSV